MGSASPGFEVKTSWNDQGFLTTVTIAKDTAASPTSYPIQVSSPDSRQGQADTGPSTTLQTSTNSVSGVFVAPHSPTVTPQAVKAVNEGMIKRPELVLVVLASALAVLIL